VLLDRVRIVRPIARGGMGKVYLGEQTTMNRRCAVKILDPRAGPAAESGDFARRFLLEASVSSKLTHPNVVTIFDYGETADGACFIAMEYLEGRSLSDELKAVGRLPPARAVLIALQVARALRAAHGLGVVHRDLKPGNVFLVTRDEEEDFVKVLDFGLVKQTTPGEAYEQTQVGQILGSPRYMAPEQVQGKPVDARADVYSLGAVLYAMLIGRPPFDKANELATMMAQVSDPPPPFASVAPELALPPVLEAIVMKCLAKKPDDRFASMEELVAALRPIPSILPAASDSSRAAAPVVATRSIAGEPAAPAARRAWLVVAAAAGAVACVGLVVALSAPQQPVGAPAAPQVTIVPHPAPPPAPTATAVLHIETDPPGAKVKEEGDTVCESTPCDVVYRGTLADPTYEHLLTFLKADYKLERKIVRASGSPLSVKLSKAR
jgi:serine/threonine-protein kinase